MAGRWIVAARGELLRLRLASGGMGISGLFVARDGADRPGGARRAGHLARRVSPGRNLRRGAPAGGDRSAPTDRSGVTDALPEPGWPTPYALLLWSALGGFDEPCRRATTWLIGRHGLTTPIEAGAIAAHDTTIDGWPWLADTHPWLEPTALSVLALVGQGLKAHPQVRSGLSLIRDRALISGGWNYGNTAVFGRPLRPQPAPTGLALLALSLAGERAKAVDLATRYLLDTLPTVRSGPSLGWGLLGLRVGRPPRGRRPLACRGRRSRERPPTPPRISPP